MKSVKNCNLWKKNILLRVDLNVPVVDGEITEKSRIEIIKPTIKKLQKQKNKIFLLSHYGRPMGERNNKYSLNFICTALKKVLEINKIFFLDDLEDVKIQNTKNQMDFGEICLFENIRFYPEEEKNDLNFIKNFSKNFDVFVNDAFSVSHRNHASIVGITKFLPSFAGYSLIHEIQNIDSFVNNPKKPNLAIIGGSKISTKIDLLYNLIENCDAIVIGGAMANTFLHAKKYNIGKSLYEKNLLETSLSIIEKSKKLQCKIILPIDVVCANDLNDKSSIRQCDVGNIFSNQMILDVGKKTTQLICSNILKSNMVLWNGPLGVFEHKPFDKSSINVAKIIKKNAKLLNIQIIAGGGDTLSLIKLAKAEDGFSYISKAGGAFLEWFEGKESPGIIALKKNKIDYSSI